MRGNFRVSPYDNLSIVHKECGWEVLKLEKPDIFVLTSVCT